MFPIWAGSVSVQNGPAQSMAVFHWGPVCMDFHQGDGAIRCTPNRQWWSHCYSILKTKTPCGQMFRTNGRQTYPETSSCWWYLRTASFRNCVSPTALQPMLSQAQLRWWRRCWQNDDGILVKHPRCLGAEWSHGKASRHPCQHHPEWENIGFCARRGFWRLQWSFQWIPISCKPLGRWLRRASFGFSKFGIPNVQALNDNPNCSENKTTTKKKAAKKVGIRWNNRTFTLKQFLLINW